MMGVNISDKRFLNHMASFAACVSAMYSASVVESEIVSCLFDDQDTAPPLSMKTYPDMACLSSWDIPSASENPYNSAFSPPKVSRKSLVDFK